MPALTDPSYILPLLRRHGVRTNKKLGQHFLINPTVCPRMAAGISAETGVLEIGPGVGVLTRELARRAGRVAAIELDAALLPVLAETLDGYDNVRILRGDVMKIDLRRVIREEFGARPTVVCANLPYYITSPILMRLLEERLPVESITVMVQREAAVRLCAAPGTRACGAVSLAVDYYASARRLFDVSPGSFLPPPAVESSVIRMTLRNDRPPVRDEAALFRLIRGAFGQRRKTLANAAVAAGFEKERLQEGLLRIGLSETARAEQLTLEEFIRLHNCISIE